MTIDEAIKRQRDMAEKYKYQLVLNETGHPMYALGDREIPRIKQYVEEYTQVAEWLEELKRYKDISSRFNKLVNDIPVYSEQMTIDEVAEALDNCADGKCARCKMSSVKRKFNANLCREQLITNMSTELNKIINKQGNKQYFCPGGYDKRTMSCDECEIPFCDYNR